MTRMIQIFKDFINFAIFSQKAIINMKNIILFVLAISLITGCMNRQENIQCSSLGEAILKETIEALQAKYPACPPERITRSVRHAGSLWWSQDGGEDEFKTFCLTHFAGDDDTRYALFGKLDKYFEAMTGHFNWMNLNLMKPVHLKYGDILPIDQMFSGYRPDAHLQNDLFDNKIAFVVALNFPFYSLQEKETLGAGWSRKEWAYARMGDMFTSRAPSELKQNYARIDSEADIYISQYNIHAGKLMNEKGAKLFPDDMVLLAHWNLRDEIKSNYAAGAEGFEKQKMIYRVMRHIIEQTIPQKVIDNPNVDWSPYDNVVKQNGNLADATPEPDARYQKWLNNFNALRAMDEYSSLDTYIRRTFDGGMEIAQADVETLFIKFMSSGVLKEIGALIASRLGRSLEPFDIWYDGFKTRSSINEDLLNEKTRKLYPTAEAMEKDLPNILMKLGYNKERAFEIAEKIAVEPARGSGHAWGAAIKGMKSYLRTRVPDSGMDYKGYNIAIHELGHNVEQTISLYDMDYYTLKRVPNTAFSEALAFIFQRRDLELLGFSETNPLVEVYQTLDLIWQTYEIMGVSLLDMRVWKWLYDNPNADKTQLKHTVIRLANEIWNDYYAPIFGSSDEPVLAIYSHSISNPLYLSNYAFGKIIDFQIIQYMNASVGNFGETVDRMYQLGRLTPNHWMKQTINAEIDIEPMLVAGKKALDMITGN